MIKGFPLLVGVDIKESNSVIFHFLLAGNLTETEQVVQILKIVFKCARLIGDEAAPLAGIGGCVVIGAY